jgi:hypothetical protein
MYANEFDGGIVWLKGRASKWRCDQKNDGTHECNMQANQGASKTANDRIFVNLRSMLVAPWFACMLHSCVPSFFWSHLHLLARPFSHTIPPSNSFAYIQAPPSYKNNNFPSVTPVRNCRLFVVLWRQLNPTFIWLNLT